MKTYEEKRPWGGFKQFTHNEVSTVKILTVNEGGKLSLQYHNKREEHWVVISGAPKITIGDTTVNAKKGDAFIVKKKEQHRIASPKGKSEILEIAYGIFDENDIIRIEDIYNRD